MEEPSPVRAELSKSLPLPILQKVLTQALSSFGLNSLIQQTADNPRLLEDFFRSEPWEQMADLTWLFDSISPEQGTAFLKHALSRIRSAVERMAEEREVFVVVLIDEVSNLSGWGQELVLQAWRHAMEDESFSRIRWVISASRPIAESPNLSPITNVFKEYNVGSLSPDECEGLLDCFGRYDWFGPDEISTECSSEHYSPGAELQPVMTFLARGFIRQLTSRLPYFMQVCLYHLFDRATRIQVPVVNRRLCAELMISHVLPEINDFLESQWRQVPEGVRERVRGSMAGKTNLDMKSFFKNLPLAELNEENFSIGTRKILIRSGLKGKDDLILAPIVALWVLTIDPDA